MPIAQSRKRNSIKNNNINKDKDRNRTKNKDNKNAMRRTKKILSGGGPKYNKTPGVETPKNKSRSRFFGNFFKSKKPAPNMLSAPEQIALGISNTKKAVIQRILKAKRINSTAKATMVAKGESILAQQAHNAMKRLTSIDNKSRQNAMYERMANAIIKSKTVPEQNAARHTMQTESGNYEKIRKIRLAESRLFESDKISAILPTIDTTQPQPYIPPKNVTNGGINPYVSSTA